MKNLLIGIVAIFVLVAGWFLFIRDAGALVDDELLVSTFTSGGEPTGKVLIQVPFLRTLEARAELSISIDVNKDQTFSEDEILVSGFPARAYKDWRSGYYAVSEIAIEDGMRARVLVDGVEHTAVVQAKLFDVGELLDLETVTDPENATKGWGAMTVYAQEGEEVTISQDGVPDLNQRKGECAPTAAANSLISLVDKNGGEDLISGDPQDFIENLKRHMDWTPENGVPPDNFVSGKNQWAAAAGVPIRTTKVGDTQGLTTIDAIREALERGDSAVELRIKFANAEGTQVVGGHMVTVTGIYQGETGTFLEINDPATPDSGTEQVKIESNQIVDYGPWRGKTLLSWGFVQTWEGHPTGELLDTMTDAEIQGIKEFVGDSEVIKVIQYGGKYLPVSQLKVESEVGCGADHWHAARGGSVTATDGTVVPDPGPQCGYGKTSVLPPMDFTLPKIEQPEVHGEIQIRGGIFGE
ncbi:MAG TPA: hypothetical protein VGA06_02730 [Candidatus Paceibacterota bacterium]|jgi:hypothetical protein